MSKMANERIQKEKQLENLQNLLKKTEIEAAGSLENAKNIKAKSSELGGLDEKMKTCMENSET